MTPLPVKKSPAKYAAGLCTNHRTAPNWTIGTAPLDFDSDLGINMATLSAHRRGGMPPGPPSADPSNGGIAVPAVDGARCHSTAPPGPGLIPRLFLISALDLVHHALDGATAAWSRWWLLNFIPLIGLIVLVVFWCSRGTRGHDKFGPDPLGAPAAA
jgi:hypothetical protein